MSYNEFPFNPYIFPKELSMFPRLKKVELFDLRNPYLAWR